MASLFRMAWRYVACYRGRSLVLACCVALVGALPITVHLLLARGEQALLARARATPLIVGMPGSRYDLMLSALYWRGHIERHLPASDAEWAARDALAEVVPVFCEHHARQVPIIGTTLAYFERRGLRPASGSLPLRLGDVVVGHAAAARLELTVGGFLLSDQASFVAVARNPPVRLRVMGILAPSNSADDQAIFADIKTTYVLAGLGHAHDDVRKLDPAQVIERRTDTVVVDRSLVDAIVIDASNAASFHFHGDPATFPLTALLLWPRDARAATWLKGRYAVRSDRQLLVPSETAEELIGVVFRLRQILDANVILVTMATTLLFGLVVLLQWRIRAREIETLQRIGCSQLRLGLLLTLELALVIAAGAALTALLVAGSVLLFDQGWLLGI
jgi:putative ABC transport system permease protein